MPTQKVGHSLNVKRQSPDRDRSPSFERLDESLQSCIPFRSRVTPEVRGVEGVVGCRSTPEAVTWTWRLLRSRSSSRHRAAAGTLGVGVAVSWVYGRRLDVEKWLLGA
jgi:hypothetical protein